MIPEPNLWADLRDRDRGLDEVEYPPHHLEVAPSNTRWGISLNFVPPKEQIKHVFCPYFVWSLTLQCLFWVLQERLRGTCSLNNGSLTKKHIFLGPENF